MPDTAILTYGIVLLFSRRVTAHQSLFTQPAPIAMNKPDSILLLLGVALISACTAGPKPDSTTPNPQTVKQIRLELETGDGVATVARNLQSWDYPVSGEQQKPEIEPTHVLSASLGQIEYASTPIGFSFQRGNPDPRGLDFQKAYIVPVTCTLRSLAHPQETATLTLRFTANPDRPDDRDTRIDHISTACYNLLSDLRIPHRGDGNNTTVTGKTPAWMPEVQIEIKQKPIPLPLTPASPAASPAKADTPPASVQTQPQTREGRKQIIIHNQGAPVILEFGYDRH